MSWAIAEKSYSQRRACGLIGLSPTTYRYEARRADDAALRARLKELAAGDGGSVTGVSNYFWCGRASS